jgi:hypothetical protein
MTRDELEQAIYERSRDFVGAIHLDCILEVIADEREKEREACAKVCDAERSLWNASREALIAGICAAAIRARGESK